MISKEKFDAFMSRALQAVESRLKFEQNKIDQKEADIAKEEFLQLIRLNYHLHPTAVSEFFDDTFDECNKINPFDSQLFVNKLIALMKQHQTFSYEIKDSALIINNYIQNKIDTANQRVGESNKKLNSRLGTFLCGIAIMGCLGLMPLFWPFTTAMIIGLAVTIAMIAIIFSVPLILAEMEAYKDIRNRDEAQGELNLLKGENKDNSNQLGQVSEKVESQEADQSNPRDSLDLDSLIHPEVAAVESDLAPCETINFPSPLVSSSTPSDEGRAPFYDVPLSPANAPS